MVGQSVDLRDIAELGTRGGWVLLATLCIAACGEGDRTETPLPVDSLAPAVADSVVGDSVMARDTLGEQD